MCRLIRLNLEGEYEIVDTGEPENALALALQHKPDVILLDLRMPSYSGYELCQTFSSFNSTQLIPVFVISGEVGGKTKELCQKLGAAAFFEKPVDFDRLGIAIAEYLKTRRLERRGEARVHLRVAIKLRAAEEGRTVSSTVTTTENVVAIVFGALVPCSWPTIPSSMCFCWGRPRSTPEKPASSARKALERNIQSMRCASTKRPQRGS